MIKGVRAPTVVSIDFSLAPFSLLPSLRTATSQWIGQVHTPELQSKVERDITQFLFHSGYRNAKTTVTAEEDDGQIEYKAVLNIGTPCVIKGYLWPDTLPPNIRLTLLENGEICDEIAAAASVDEVERRFHERGWVQASLDFGGFVTDQAETDAYIRVLGTFGEKISYEFVDPATGLSIINQLTTSEIQTLDPSSTGPDAAGYELAHLLKNRGYLDVNITGPEVKREQNGTAKYVFSVARGELYRISSVQFEGNEHFSNNELATTMKIDFSGKGAGGTTEESNLPPYSPDLISSGMDAIKNAYILDGYWDVKLSERLTQKSDSDRQRVQIVISIEEGKRRVFDRLEITGSTQISVEEISDFWDVDHLDSFDQSALLTLQQKIRTAYASRGYFYTTVAVELANQSSPDSPDQQIIIKIKVDEGPRVRFGDIFVAGLVKTKQKVVTREVLFETGDWYDPELVLASRKALLALGIFSSVTITPVDPLGLSSRAEMIDFLIEVKESPSRTVSFGPGWSSFYGMRYSVEGSLTNIGGTGRQVYSSASFDQEKSQNAIGPRTLVGRSISAGYLEPHILDSSINGTVSANQLARATDYAWALTRSGEIELSHTLRSVVPGSKIAGFYGRKLSEEESNNVIKDAFLADTFRVGRVGTRFIIDHRDDLSWPTSGYTLNSELSWARYELGGDVRYFKWEVGNNRYLSITDNLVFAVGINFSAFQGVTRKNESSQDILPASERLNIGGSDSVRGFRERSLGPIVRRPDLSGDGTWSNGCGYTETATGGTRRTLLKTELRYRWTSSIATTGFIDSGNTSFSSEEMAKFSRAFSGTLDVPSSTCGEARFSIEDNIGYELADLATHPGYIWERHFTSAGAAVNFLTPIGSINLAYGVPWHEPKSKKCKENDSYCFSRTPKTDIWWKKGEIHLNVGAKF